MLDRGRGRAEGTWKRDACLGPQWSRKLSRQNPNERERGVGKSRGVSSNKNGMWTGSKQSSRGCHGRLEKEVEVTSLGPYLLN